MSSIVVQRAAVESMPRRLGIARLLADDNARAGKAGMRIRNQGSVIRNQSIEFVFLIPDY
jgi:hypothetical protein